MAFSLDIVADLLQRDADLERLVQELRERISELDKKLTALQMSSHLSSDSP